MKFHNVDMQGPFSNEILDVLPVFDAARDERRLVYLSTDDTLYLGTGTGWVAIIVGSGTLSNTADVMIRKFICDVDLTQVGSSTIWTVGEDAMFLINSFEVVIEDASGTGTMPYVSFGVDLDNDCFVTSQQLNTDMNVTLRRQVWERPYGAALQDTQLLFNVDVASTKSTHTACIVVTGYLLPTDVYGPNIPYPAHNIIFTAERFTW